MIEETNPVFYAVVFEGMPTVYIHADNDEAARESAQHLAHYVDKPLRLVFVSAHNDPANGPSGMRKVWSRCEACGGRGQNSAGGGEHFQTSLCRECHGEGFLIGEGETPYL